MGTLSPQGVRARELLADGKWRRYDDVLAEVMKVIQPGAGMRQAERERVSASGTAKRKIPRSNDYLIDYGRRRIAGYALRTVAFEEKLENGVKYIRLRTKEGHH